MHSQTWATVRAVIEPTSSEYDEIALAGGTFNPENTDVVVNGATSVRIPQEYRRGRRASHADG
ncbi:hypothetical protein GCM10023152_10600 [Agromyces bauzanensis]|uniref:Uncharacterized protein n=1 Tax=Agromyces bauzanensis TaxID=1308924 RepID=A0A917P9X7_9MICO|nr:hypothetical protein [Agromyces bauzanensis]GGJ68085.1 hypothetical protein GCM10011372_02330 [Agromyces bauzanensis]